MSPETDRQQRIRSQVAIRIVIFARVNNSISSMKLWNNGFKAHSRPFAKMTMAIFDILFASYLRKYLQIHRNDKTLCRKLVKVRHYCFCRDIIFLSYFLQSSCSLSQPYWSIPTCSHRNYTVEMTKCALSAPL